MRKSKEMSITEVKIMVASRQERGGCDWAGHAKASGMLVVPVFLIWEVVPEVPYNHTIYNNTNVVMHVVYV